MVAAAHRNIPAYPAIASASAAEAMLAGADARHGGGGKESRWRLFLAVVAALANVSFALFSRSPIERGELCFGHGLKVAMRGGARERQIVLVLSALLAYVIVCCFWHGA